MVITCKLGQEEGFESHGKVEGEKNLVFQRRVV